MNTIPVVFISDSHFIVQTSVAISSLIANKNPDTQYIVYIIASDCKLGDFAALTNLADIHIIESHTAIFSDIKQVQHVPIACLLKFFVCDFIPEYDKLLYLDGDIIVKGDLKALYEVDVEEYYAAAVFSRIDAFDKKKKINAGIMLFNAKKMREENMGQKLMEYRRTLGDRASMDQQSFNSMLGDCILPLHVKYNCTPAGFQEETERHGITHLNELFSTQYKNLEEMIDDACIIHYASGLKPWKYHHAPYGEIWNKYFLLSPYAAYPLKKQNRLEQRLEIFINEFKKNGLLGLSKRIIDFVKYKITGKRQEIHWG